MLLPINWLKEYVQILETPEQVAERFISLGFEARVMSNNILDLEITPNRGDALSILGLAREYAAVTNQSVKMPEISKLPVVPKLPGFSLQAEPAAYHRISALMINNVNIVESPQWLRERIESVGLRSINNIVDLTNYVMFELGIPLHAFDLDALPSPEFQLRLSKEGEVFRSLKNEERTLPTGLIVVDSGGEIIDLVGVRGGKSTAITDKTKNILLFAVSLPRPLIRKATKLLNIRTEGSYRHERETDWSMVPIATARMAELLKDFGLNTTGAIDLAATEQPTKNITIDYQTISNLLGTDISKDLISNQLLNLGFKVNDQIVTVPSWRYFDISTPEDIAEEVGRLQGYDTLPRKIIKKIERAELTNYERIEALKDKLVELGLTEVHTESFSGQEEAKIRRWKTDQLATLANPVNRDFTYCRAELLPNLVKLLALNAWADDIMLFEIGHVFPTADLEQVHLALASVGKNEKLFSKIVPPDKVSRLNPDDPLAKLYKLRRSVAVAEIPITDVFHAQNGSFQMPKEKPAYRPVSPFPPAVRDVALLVEAAIPANEISQWIQRVGGAHIIYVELFDRFTSPKLGPNKQSLAYHIIYQSMVKTLDTKEVESIHQKVIESLVKQFNATIR